MGSQPTHVDVYLNTTLVATSTEDFAIVDISNNRFVGNFTLHLIARGTTTQYAISSTQEDLPGPLFEAQAYVGITIERFQPISEAVVSHALGFIDIAQHETYEYGPAIVQEDGTFYAFYCSPGDGVIWDFIRLTTR